MRVSLKRAIWWVCVLVLLQVVVYYWSMKRPRKYRSKIVPHKYIEAITGDDGTCSYLHCPAVKNDYINVHFVPHSHIDVGWLKTVDQYYTGEIPRDYYKGECVRCTLNTTIAELLQDPKRRFIFVEMKYFQRYWNEIDDKQRKIIRKLIEERRLELVNGGWVMSDAGITMYNDIIDQHTLGFDFIRETFGPCAQSRTAWHVDQFGHSREHASLFAQMGYDSLFVGRIDYQDLAERKATKNLEFVWKTSPKNLKDKTTLFTQATFDGYYAPPTFVFDDISTNIFKSDLKVLNFIKILKERARTFKTNHLLVPMGSDFGYMKAVRWFSNIDTLIEKVIQMKETSPGLRLNLLYSTPSCYTYHVNGELETFETKEDDFHPYGIAPGVYWTGYFTTRGGFKRHIKQAGQILQSCKQLSIFADLSETFNKVNVLRDAMAVMQHHDAITGTQKKHVLNDYNRLLSIGTKECQTVMSMAYTSFWSLASGGDGHQPMPSPRFCHGLNISSCEVSEGTQPFLITMYNLLAWPADVNFRFPVKKSKMTILDGDGKEVNYQLVPVPELVTKIPERLTSSDTEVVILTRLPPLSMTTFKVQPERGGVKPVFDTITEEKFVTIENEYLRLKFSTKTGMLTAVDNKVSGITESVSQDFAYYEGQDGGPRASGAYVFVPKYPTHRRVSDEEDVEIKVLRGEFVEEVHQTFSSWVSQVVRLHKGANYAELQWTVGPIDDREDPNDPEDNSEDPDFEYSQGKEVVSVFSTSIDNQDVFYTDSNGREMMQRMRDMRDTWHYKSNDHVSGNYYPVTSKILIKDDKRNVQLTILPDRPQGGSSLASGSLELMVHRKLFLDDGLGVGEPLNDRGVDGKGIMFTGKHYLCLETIEKSSLLTKHLGYQIHMAPVPMFTPLVGGRNYGDILKQQSFLTNSLPHNVHLLTLDRITMNDTNLFLLRLEHIFEVDEHWVLSKPAEVSLEYMFKPFDIISVEETTLGGNFRPEDISRLQWKTETQLTPIRINSSDYSPHMISPFTVTLQPMEIRTFRVQVARIL